MNWVLLIVFHGVITTVNFEHKQPCLDAAWDLATTYQKDWTPQADRMKVWCFQTKGELRREKTKK